MHNEMAVLTRKLEEVERENTLMKAKEYDKIDVLRRNADLEGRLKILESEHEQVCHEKGVLEQEKEVLERTHEEMESEMEGLRLAQEK